MPEVNLPEEYYQANGYTKLSAGSGPHLGADANLSFDIVEKQEIISAQPMSVGGQLKCYERTKITRSQFTWRLNPQTRKFSLVEEKPLGIFYGPLIEIPCPKALKDQYDKTPELIDVYHSRHSGGRVMYRKYGMSRAQGCAGATQRGNPEPRSINVC